MGAALPPRRDLVCGSEPEAMRILQAHCLDVSRYAQLLESMSSAVAAGEQERHNLPAYHKKLAGRFFKDAKAVTRVLTEACIDVLAAASLLTKGWLQRSLRSKAAVIRAKLRPSAVRPFQRLSGKSSREVGEAAAACVAFAQANKSALRDFQRAYLEACSSQSCVSQLVELCWQNVSIGGFLSSPLLVEMQAIAALQAAETDLNQGFIHGAQIRNPQVGPGITAGTCGHDQTPEVSCPICLEAVFSPVGLACGHTFCSSCLQVTLKATQVPCDTSGVMLRLESATREGDLASQLHHVDVRDIPICCPQCRQTSRLGNAIRMPHLEKLAQATAPQEWSEKRKRHLNILAGGELERLEHEKTKPSLSYSHNSGSRAGRFLWPPRGRTFAFNLLMQPADTVFGYPNVFGIC